MLKVFLSTSMSSSGGWPFGLNDLVGLVIMLLTTSMAYCCSPLATRRATLACVTWAEVVVMSLVLLAATAAAAAVSAVFTSIVALWTAVCAVVRRADAACRDSSCVRSIFG
jgi:hypothetical protein